MSANPKYIFVFLSFTIAIGIVSGSPLPQDMPDWKQTGYTGPPPTDEEIIARRQFVIERAAHNAELLLKSYALEQIYKRRALRLQAIRDRLSLEKEDKQDEIIENDEQSIKYNLSCLIWGC